MQGRCLHRMTEEHNRQQQTRKSCEVEGKCLNCRKQKRSQTEELRGRCRRQAAGKSCKLQSTELQGSSLKTCSAPNEDGAEEMWSFKLSNARGSCKHAAPQRASLSLVAPFLGIIVKWDGGNRGNRSDET